MKKSELYIMMVIVSAAVSVAGGFFFYLYKGYPIAVSVGLPVVVFFISLAYLNEQFSKE